MKKYLFLIIFLLAFFIFSTQGYAWLSGYDYRKPVNVSVSSGSTQTYYTVPINVTSLTNMQSDCDDVRFTSTTDGLLDYWLEAKSDGNWCYFWIEIDSNITTTNQTLVYMYYNNTSVSTTSNISNAFIFGDDFNRDESSTIGNDWEENTIGGNITNNSMFIDGGQPAWSVHHDFTATSNSISVGFLAKELITGGDSLRWVSGGKDIFFFGGASFTIQFGSGNLRTTPFWTNIQTYTTNVWYRIESRMNSTRENFTINGTDYSKDYNNNYAISEGSQTSFSTIDFACYHYPAVVDWVYVREYQLPQPTYSIGSEETKGIPTSIQLWLNGVEGNATISNETLLNSTAQINESVWVAIDINGTLSANDTNSSFNMTYLPIGIWNITAYFNGDDAYLPSNKTYWVKVNYYPDGLISYWKFDDDALDFYGLNNGTRYNFTDGYVTGKYGNALEFNSTAEQFVDVGNDSSLNFGTGDFSIEAWVKTSAIRSGIIRKVGGVTNTGYYTGTQDYALGFYVADNTEEGVWITTADATNANNQWHHIVDVRIGNDFYIYINGSLATSATVTVGNIDNIYNLTFGKGLAVLTSGYFNGTIDNVRIWNNALTEEEIGNLHDCNQLETCPMLTIVEPIIVCFRIKPICVKLSDFSIYILKENKLIEWFG